MIVATPDTLHKVPDNDTSVIFFDDGRPVVYRSHDFRARMRWLLDLLKRKPKEYPPPTPLERVS